MPEEHSITNRAMLPSISVSLYSKTSTSAGFSSTGCFLRAADLPGQIRLGDRLAIGFVLPSRDVGLVRGRVVRRIAGEGVGIQIEQANEPFDELIGTLATGQPSI